MKAVAASNLGGVELQMTDFPCLKCRTFVHGKPIEGMVFSTLKDLDLHLAAWPGNKSDHQRALQLAHEEAGLTQYRLHGGADRVVSQIAGLIIELKKKVGFCWICQKDGVSVRWVEDCWMCEPCWEAWQKKKEAFR